MTSIFKILYYLEDHLSLKLTEIKIIAFGVEVIFQFVFPDADSFHLY